MTPLMTRQDYAGDGITWCAVRRSDGAERPEGYWYAACPYCSYVAESGFKAQATASRTKHEERYHGRAL